MCFIGWKEMCRIDINGNAVSGERDLCSDARMDDYLAKPFRAEVLRDLPAMFL